MQHEVNMLSNFIALNTVSFKGPGRRQRSAPLSFIGGLSRTLFGTATAEDLQIVANRVNDLIRRNRNITGAILSHAKNFKSYMRIENVRFQNMGNMIDGVITNMKGLEDRSNTIVDEIKASNEMLALTFLAGNVTDSFRYKINEIRDAIIDLQKGYISEFLIPDEDFRAAIDKIIQKAAETYSNTNIVNRAAHYYRRHGSSIVRYNRRKKQLWVTVKFAVGPNSRDTLYMVTSFPVPYGKGSNHATRIADVPHYIVVRQQSSGIEYATLTDSDFISQCHTIGSYQILCSMGLVFKTEHSADCVIALLKNNNADIHRRCTFTFLKDHYKEGESSLDVLTSNSVLVTRQDRLNMDCKNSKRVIRGCHFCMIKLPCQCTIRSNTVEINTYSSSDCEDKTEKIGAEYHYLMNFAVLRSSLDTLKRKFIDASITTDVEQDFSLPSVQFHDSAYSHFLATDQENKLLMDKVGERVRHNKEIFTSLGDAILAGEIPLQSKSMSTREVLTIVLFIIFCIMMILFFVYQCLFFDQHLRNLKKKDLKQDNVSPEEVKKKIVSNAFKGERPEARSQCLRRAIPQNSGIQNIRDNEEGSCTSEGNS